MNLARMLAKAKCSLLAAVVYIPQIFCLGICSKSNFKLHELFSYSVLLSCFAVQTLLNQESLAKTNLDTKPYFLKNKKYVLKCIDFKQQQKKNVLLMYIFKLLTDSK